MIRQRFLRFMTVRDDRFEGLTKDKWKSIVYRDSGAGLIVAMTAIRIRSECVLGSSMAHRLADNGETPLNPDKKWSSARPDH